MTAVFSSGNIVPRSQPPPVDACLRVLYHRAGIFIIAYRAEGVNAVLRESETESYQFECGAPVFGDVLETTRPDYRLKMIALHEELAKIPDALLWLELVMQGEKPRKAARRLHHGWNWYCRVLDVCRHVLLE